MSLYIVAASIFVFDPWEMLIDTPLPVAGKRPARMPLVSSFCLAMRSASCVLFAAALSDSS